MTKLLKKSLAVVLSVALCLSVMVCGFVASADGEPTITLVADNATPSAGDTVKIDVKVANFDAVAGAQFDVVLGGLEYVSVASDAIEDIDAFTNVVDGDVRLVNEYMNDADAGYVDISAANGVLFTITATVPADAAAETAYTVAIADAKFCEGGEGEPEVDVKAESVTLTVPAAGPVEPTEPDATLKDAIYKTQLKIGSAVGFYYTIIIPKAKLAYEYDSIAFEVSMPELELYQLTGENKVTVIDSTSGDAFDDRYASAGMYYITFEGVALFEMILEITPTLKLYKDGNLVGYYTYPAQTFEEVAVNYYLNDAASAKQGKEIAQKFAVDLLNMGAEAQNYFANHPTYAPNYLTGKTLPNTSDKIDWSKKTTPKTTDTSATTDKEITAQLQLLAAPSFYYKFVETNYKTPSALTFTATYTSGAHVDPNDETSDNIVQTRSVNGAELGTGAGEEGEYSAYGLTYFSFNKVALYDSNKPVTFTITASDGKTWNYIRTLDSFLVDSINQNVDAKDVYAAVLAFGESTRAFWPEYVNIG